MKYIFGISMTVFLSYGAAGDQPQLNLRFVGVKTRLVDLALQIVMSENINMSSGKSGYIDMQLSLSVDNGGFQIADIPADLKCPIPLTSRIVARKLTESAEISYRDRDRVVQTYFGPRLREGEGFVRDRKALFEALLNQPQIANAIMQKQKEPTL